MFQAVKWKDWQFSESEKDIYKKTDILGESEN